MGVYLLSVPAMKPGQQMPTLLDVNGRTLVRDDGNDAMLALILAELKGIRARLDAGIKTQSGIIQVNI